METRLQTSATGNPALRQGKRLPSTRLRWSFAPGRSCTADAGPLISPGLRKSRFTSVRAFGTTSINTDSTVGRSVACEQRRITADTAALKVTRDLLVTVCFRASGADAASGAVLE